MGQPAPICRRVCVSTTNAYVIFCASFLSLLYAKGAVSAARSHAVNAAAPEDAGSGPNLRIMNFFAGVSK